MIALPNPNARTARIIVTTTAIVVTLSVAIAAAGLTWRILGYQQSDPLIAPSAAQTSVTDTQAAIALAPFGKAPVDDSGSATSLPLELKGVFASPSEAHAIAFIAINGAAPVSIRVGERVGTATLVAVRADRVILSNGGRNEYLAFADPTLSVDGSSATTVGQAPGSNPSSSSPLVPGVPLAPGNATGPGAAAGSPDTAILQSLDASPTQNGYLIGAKAPPGLQSGDVVETVNNTNISDPNAARAAFANAQANGSAQLQILRDGKRITLNVPLR